ncbi:MAG: type II toxin-antitoxin system HicB family antitoxin [Anaerolineae bacterium]|nr:type II toxin-antitoxin system HicB family antitoxin [Anaerolineae bacterium]
MTIADDRFEMTLLARRKKLLNRIMNLPYKIEVIPEEDGQGFTAVISDLKGCMAFGETIEEAYQMITEIKQAWIEIALERGWAIKVDHLRECGIISVGGSKVSSHAMMTDNNQWPCPPRGRQRLLPRG